MFGMKERPAAIWFEVENFLRYFEHYVTPTGIQRVCFEIFSAAHQLSGREIQINFCRLCAFTGRFEQVSYEQVSRAYVGRLGAGAPWSILPLPRSPWREWRTILGAASRFPRYVYQTVGQFLGDIAEARVPGDENELAPGDVIVALGSSWVTQNFSRVIARLKRNQNVRFVQLVHDVIPVQHPEWTPWFGAPFFRWVQEVAAVSDVLLTISQSSRKDLESFAMREGFALPPVRTIRFGAGFPSGFQMAAPSAARVPSSIVESLPKRFVLCVSTIEPRKNHQLLLTVWRNLIARYGSEKITHLVLVGRAGYFVLDTQSLRSRLVDPSLHQRIITVGHLNDADLAEVYRRCLFTVFPSFYEGWGLPVEESLVNGKFCVASNSSSMPEVGGEWVDYFDPKDPDEAQRVLERALFEPGYVEARERRIRDHYRPSSWRDCTRQLIEYVDGLPEHLSSVDACAGAASTMMESTSS
jgi:glycosyltransferase involved in cell wall biosynthesis